MALPGAIIYYGTKRYDGHGDRSSGAYPGNEDAGLCPLQALRRQGGNAALRAGYCRMGRSRGRICVLRYTSQSRDAFGEECGIRGAAAFQPVDSAGILLHGMIYWKARMRRTVSLTGSGDALSGQTLLYKAIHCKRALPWNAAAPAIKLMACRCA
jgi:hypothetical protein